MRERVAIIVAAVALPLLAPNTGAAVSSTVRLTIAHVLHHCHVWQTSRKTLGAATRIVVRPGTRLVIRSNCPMDFDYAQTAGPRLALGNPRTFAGDSRLLVFRSKGVYRLTATNVQTPEERGLVTLGAPNALRLTIVVR